LEIVANKNGGQLGTSSNYRQLGSYQEQKIPEVMLIYVVSLCEPNGQIGYGWVRQDMDVIPIVV